MTYELDPMKSLDYPLMLDASCPQTRRFLNAMNHATSFEEELSSGEVSVVDFQQAVMDAEDAFFEAEGHAKKMRYAHLDAGQKKKIRDARPLVALLDDEDASPHEKVSAYRKKVSLPCLSVPSWGFLKHHKSNPSNGIAKKVSRVIE